jgi:hypothetical protein
MGADIHDYAEVRRAGRWEKVGAVFLNPRYDCSKPSPLLCWVDAQRFEEDFHPRRGEPCGPECYARNPQLTDQPFVARDYCVFAILAGVRNYSTEAGDAFVPVAPPRGLPGDVSPEVARLSEFWDGDGHSHSWLTLREVLAYDWSRTVTYRGFVDAREYLAFKDHGRPTQGYSMGTGGRVVSNRAMEKAIAAGRDAGCATEVEWGETCVTSAADFWDRTVPALLGLLVPPELMGEASAFLAASRAGDATAAAVLDDWLHERGLPPTADVRMVFWFDN